MPDFDRLKKKCSPSLFFLAIFLFFLLLLLIRPRFSLHLEFRSVSGEGTLRVYQLNDDLREQNVDSQGEVLTPGTQQLKMAGYPLDLYAVRLDLYDVESLDIEALQVRLWGIPLYTYSTQWLDWMSVDPYQIELLPGDGVFTCTPTAGNSCFTILVPTALRLSMLTAYLVLLGLLSLALAALLLRPIQRFSRWRVAALLCIAASGTLLVGESIPGSPSLISLPCLWLNFLLIFTVYAALSFLPRLWIGVGIGTLFFGIWYSADAFVQQFRSQPLLPSDLLAAGTAAEVAGSYDLTPTNAMWCMILWLVVITGAAFLLQRQGHCSPPVHTKTHRLLKAASVVVSFLLCFSVFVPSLAVSHWAGAIPSVFQRQGMVVTFLKYYQNGRPAKPSGYSSAAVEEILDQYTIPQTCTGTQPTNILMVMNESLADMRVGRTDYTANELEFWNSLIRNTVHGNLFVSTRGGGTSNTEFETLTGNSMAFLPAGSAPYVNLIRQPLFSLARYFQNAGYQTAGLHLMDRSNYNRNTIYPLLGLSSFWALEDYDSVDALRGYATDRDDYQKLIALEESMANAPRFLFNVTIQNHGGYSAPGDTPITVDLSHYGDYPEAELYLSLVTLSDEALKELIDHYQQVDEPTMIIVYGDHQPALGDDTDEWLFGSNAGPLSMFETPFLIWTNYPIESRNVGDMSANYLPMLILETANMPLPPYFLLLKDVYQEYPVITSHGVVDREGNYYTSLNQIENDPLLNRYQIAQYNGLFDKNGRVDALFEAPAA